MEAISQEHRREVAFVEAGATLLYVFLRTHGSTTRKPFVSSLMEVERDGPRLIFAAIGTGTAALGLGCFQLRPGLLAVADGVVSAEWNLLSAGQEEFLAAFHQVLLVEGPRVHEILE